MSKLSKDEDIEHSRNHMHRSPEIRETILAKRTQRLSLLCRAVSIIRKGRTPTKNIIPYCFVTKKTNHHKEESGNTTNKKMSTHERTRTHTQHIHTLKDLGIIEQLERFEIYLSQ